MKLIFAVLAINLTGESSECTCRPPFNPWRGNAIDVKSYIGKTFTLQFEIMPYAINPKWTNILFVTTTGDRGPAIGARIPALWFRPGTTKLRMHTDFEDLGKRDFYGAIDNDFSLSLHRWHLIKISQEYHGSGVYKYKLEVDNVLHWIKVNPHPKVYRNTVVYMSEPWENFPNALVKNYSFN